MNELEGSAIVAERVRWKTAVILEAHDLSVEPGTMREPWTLEAQRRIISIYGMTLPNDFLVKMERDTRVAAGVMDRNWPRGEIERDWSILHRFLTAVSTAIRELPSLDQREPTPGFRSGLQPVGPAITRFDLIARVLHTDGVLRLQTAAKHSLGYCRRPSFDVLTAEELSWLKALSGGGTVIDLAIDSHLSRRTVYRRLDIIWAKLGVDNKAQALVAASAMGLLDDINSSPGG